MTVTPHDLGETLRRRYRRLAIEEDQERSARHRALASALEAVADELLGLQAETALRSDRSPRQLRRLPPAVHGGARR